MNKELRHAIHQLKGKSFPDSLLAIFYRESKEAFSLLHEGVSAGKFTPMQARNALVVMYNLCRQHCIDQRTDLFELTCECSVHSDLEIRSQAAMILAKILRLVEDEVWSSGFREFDRTRALSSLQSALKLTLSKEATDYIKNVDPSIGHD